MTTSFGAIPVYLAILKLYIPTLPDRIPVTAILLSPVALFLLAAIIFIIAYLRRIGGFPLDVVEEIENAIEKSINERQRLMLLGFAFFICGIIIAIISVLFVPAVKP